MRALIEELKAVTAKIEEKWVALEADFGVASTAPDPAPADPVVEAPVAAPVEEAAVDDGSAANEPVPEVGADATQDPTPAPEATEQL